MPEELEAFARWYEFLKWMLDVTAKFPRTARFTVTSRVDNLALDVLETIIEYRYDRRARRSYAGRLNIKLEKLRVLFRLCHDRKYVSNSQYERAVVGINEVGNLVGGWLKEAGFR